MKWKKRRQIEHILPDGAYPTSINTETSMSPRVASPTMTFPSGRNVRLYDRVSTVVSTRVEDVRLQYLSEIGGAVRRPWKA